MEKKKEKEKDVSIHPPPRKTARIIIIIIIIIIMISCARPASQETMKAVGNRRFNFDSLKFITLSTNYR